ETTARRGAAVLCRAPAGAGRPRRRVGRGDVGAAERGETGEEALEVALEGDELADQHHRGRIVARRGEALLIGGGDQRRGGRQQVHMVAEGLEGGIVRDQIGGDQGLLRTLGAVPFGEGAAALPVRRGGGEGVQHTGREALRRPIQRVIGGQRVG